MQKAFTERRIPIVPDRINPMTVLQVSPAIEWRAGGYLPKQTGNLTLHLHNDGNPFEEGIQKYHGEHVELDLAGMKALRDALQEQIENLESRI